MAKNTTITLTDKEAELAHTSILAIFKGYVGKTGLQSVEQKYLEKKDNLSQHIMALAHEAASVAKGNTSAELARFRALCTEAEHYLMAEYRKAAKLPDTAKVSVNGELSILPVWPVFKSAVVGALKAGITTKDLPTITAVKKARDAARKAAGRPPHSNDKPESEEATAEGGSWSDNVKAFKPLRDALVFLDKSLPALGEQSQKHIAKALKVAIDHVLNLELKQAEREREQEEAQASEEAQVSEAA